MSAKNKAKLVVLPTSLVASILVAIFGPKVDGIATSSIASYVTIGLAAATTIVHGPKVTKAALRKAYLKAVRYAIKQRATALVNERRAVAPAQFTMYDSVDITKIPANASAVAGYVDGYWPTFQQLVRKFPAAKRLSIAVSADANAICLDIESGDATPAEAAKWVRRQQARGVRFPVLYCSASLIRAVLAALGAEEIKRDEIRLWSAHYTGQAHICHPSVCGYEEADATQWTQRSRGKNLDQSLCSPGFI